METLDWDRLEHLFERLLALAPHDRQIFLDEVGREHPALRAELVSLLAAEEGAADFFDNLAADLPVLPPMGTPLQPDQYVGRYRLVQELGVGGMGRVFLAERSGVGGLVALKLIKGGLAAPEAVARFLQERRLLARLQHPHIARLLDAGMTDDNAPFFAMEYVDGEPLTAYCDRHRLDVEQRLRLFVQMGTAVAYAHRNLVVHRDLKPSNIFVAEGPDGEPQLKLLDFGIAKLLEETDEDTADAPRTRTGVAIMTPAYAAPEQVRGDAITTATDVYALGVLLFELLTGQRPYDTSGRTTEVMERILHVQPPRPSAVIASTTEAAATQRRTTAERLRRDLTGDLDTIILKALRKEPERRYASAEQFVDDIRRYLRGQPVTARPDTFGYRLQKFVQRNRVSVAAASLVLASLVVGLGVALWQSQQAEAARDRAERELATSEAVSGFLTDLFDVSNPYSSETVQSDTLTALHLLQQGAARIGTTLAGQPRLQAVMYDKIGSVYEGLSRYADAESLFTRSLALRQTLQPEDADLSESYFLLGKLAHQRNDSETAQTWLQQALAAADSAASPNRYARILSGLGSATHGLGDYETARIYHERASALLNVETRADSVSRANMHAEYGLTLRLLGDYEGTLSEYQTALDLRRHLLPPAHPLISESLNNIGMLYLQNLGRHELAEQYFQQALDEALPRLDSAHVTIAVLLNNIAQSLQEQGRHAEAAPVLQQAITRYRAAVGGENAGVGLMTNNLAYTLSSHGDHEGSIARYEEALAIFRRVLGSEHTYVARVHNNIAGELITLGRYAEAEAALQEALRIRTALYGDAHADIALVLMTFASLYKEQGDLPRAIDHYERALAMRRQVLGPDEVPTGLSMLHLARAHRDATNYPAAESLYVGAHRILADKLGPEHDRTLEARTEIASFYEAQENPTEAQRWR